MARIECKCGQILSNSNNPEIQYKIFSDENWIELLDREDNGERAINLDLINSYEGWKCDNCKRIHIFKNGFDKIIHTYKLENENLS